MELDAVADELYGLAPAEFTAARNAQVAAAKGAGDRALAAAIAELRRPTKSAWLVNRLVRERRDQVAELLDLGAGMRDAQQQLAGEDLRELSRRRRQLVEKLAREGTELATRSGESVSGEMTRELAATLEAALADPEAGEAVLAGRLTDALSYSGFGLAPAPVHGHAGRERRSDRPKMTPPSSGKKRDAGGRGGIPPAHRGADAARARVEAAEVEAGEARRAADGAADRATAAVDADAALRRRIGALESELADLRQQVGAVSKAVRAARREQEVAERAAAAAAARLDRARG